MEKELTGVYGGFKSALCLVIISVIPILYEIPRLIPAVQSLGWPQVRGEVLSSRIKTYNTLISVHDAPEVTYKYVVDGKDYKGSRLMFASTVGDGARGLLDQFPVGARIPVYYSPKDPSISTLIPGTTLSEVSFILVISGIPLAIGLSTFYHWYRGKNDLENGLRSR